LLRQEHQSAAEEEEEGEGKEGRQTIALSRSLAVLIMAEAHKFGRSTVKVFANSCFCSSFGLLDRTAATSFDLRGQMEKKKKKKMNGRKSSKTSKRKKY
jgi:hypothetical protein